ncbi:MAG: hypothetical protein VKO00_05795 [Cyanobacteriota bacterium]|nr:hypothetical protein [Cyanobacteriota bacterium]
MTVTTLPHRPAAPVPHRPGSGPVDHGQRQALLDQAAQLFAQARQAAAAGDLSASGRAILEALGCERRAGGVGPQVLQLIKPRH